MNNESNIKTICNSRYGRIRQEHRVGQWHINVQTDDGGAPATDANLGHKTLFFPEKSAKIQYTRNEN